uniref:Putative membrane protein n=1 Tax=Amblyomma tuberculatum TaxID=48802 RepID=A0A6M2E2W1_9ACAR
MAVLHKVLLAWFLFHRFLVLLALRLDEKTDWNWFIVFVPMWAFDIKLFLYLTIRLMKSCKRRHDNSREIRRRLWALCCLLLKSAFSNMPLYATAVCFKFSMGVCGLAIVDSSARCLVQCACAF